MSHLQRWAEAHGIPIAEIASRIGKHRNTVYRYIRGDDMPRPAVVAQIATLTDGTVTAAHLHEDYQAAQAGKV